jgi:hypothetical protein
MIVVANEAGRGGILSAMETLRLGGTALNAVVAGIAAVERARDDRRGDQRQFAPPERREGSGAVLTPTELAGAQPDVWGRWRRRLAAELHLDALALARMEWLVGLGAAALGPLSPADRASFVARDHDHDLGCGICAIDAGPGGGATRRVALALRSGHSLGEALREALADLANLVPPLDERISMHSLARDRIPIGASHRPGQTFLYLRAEMAEYAERDCLYVA